MMKHSSPYTRPLSPFERIWIAGHSSCSMLLIEGVGDLSLEALRQAATDAARHNAGSQLVLRGIGPWAAWHSSPASVVVETVEAGGWDGLSPVGAPFDALHHMDVRQNPSHSWLLIRGNPTRLILRAHHATMDGRGMLTLAEDLFRALRGERLLGTERADTDLEIARQLGGRPRASSPPAISPFPPNTIKEMGSTWQRLRITGPGKPQLLARTVASIARAARRHHLGEVLIDLPVDLRRHMPGIRHLGNLTGSLRLSVATDATLENIAAQITHGIAENHHADALVSAAWIRYLPVAAIGVMARRQAHQAIHQQRFTSSAVVSNVGYFSPPSYSTPGFKAHSALVIPPGYDGLPLFLCMSGHQESLDLCARAPKALAHNGQLSLLLDEIAAALRAN